ncbi:MAG: heterodisulfide reductase-related iron-sulfur binding cluster, partial [bacterium]|nr:heterodisulfide reductase-related iron-sulfur binding cluster [bacterium]
PGPGGALRRLFPEAEDGGEEASRGPRKGGNPDRVQGKIRIRHLADYFWEDVGPKKIREKIRKPLAGLKPVCYYGCLTVRPPRVTGARKPEDPQEMDSILKILGARVMNWSYKTDCCGGSLVLARPDIVRRLVGRLLANAEEAGADCVVTACPLCQANLDGQQDEIVLETGKKPKLPIFYFTELMGLAFQNPEAKSWWKRHLTDPRKFLKEKGLI